MLLGRYLLWDYIAMSGKNEILEWIKSLSIEDQARLDQKLNSLMTVEFDLLQKTKALQGPINKSQFIYKLRIMSKGNLRPLLCKGPQAGEDAYTLLQGAAERGGKWEPKQAVQKALDHRGEVVKDPTRRRPHERTYRITQTAFS